MTLKGLLSFLSVQGICSLIITIKSVVLKIVREQLLSLYIMWLYVATY